MPTFWKPADLPLTEVFIETGTQRGDSLAVAVGTGYASCLSVEYTDLWHNYAKERFAKEPRVRLFRGSSPQMLPQIIDPNKSTTFWLDAHYCGNDKTWQDPRYGECPLLEELKVITHTPWRELPFICIDDAFIFRDATWVGPSHVFEPALFTRSHWPRMAEIEQLLPDFDIREENYVLFCRPKH